MSFGYFEALRVAWRILWPPATAAGGILSLVHYYGRISSWDSVVFLIVNSLALFAFIHRVVTRKYIGFQLVVIRDDGSTNTKIHFRERMAMWFFVYSRQAIAAVGGWFLLAPLNILLALFAVRLSGLVSLLAIIFLINPVIARLLVDHAFEGFHLEPRPLTVEQQA